LTYLIAEPNNGHEKVPRPTKKEQNAEAVLYWFVDPFGTAKKSSKEFPLV
jgi:hypothetical protein